MGESGWQVRGGRVTRLPNPNRRHTVTEKVDRSMTGLNGSVFVHVDYLIRSGHKEIVAIRMVEKGKDGSTLDAILDALSKAATSIICDELGNK